MKHSLLAIFAMFTVFSFGNLAHACGEEEPVVAADGTTELSGLNMECLFENHVLAVQANYSWGSCLTSQVVEVEPYSYTKMVFKNSDRSETPRHDELRQKVFQNGALLIKLKQELNPSVQATLVLTRDPKRDRFGKAWNGRVKLPAYKGI